MSETLKSYCHLARRRADLKAKLADVERSLDAAGADVVVELRSRHARSLPAFSAFGMVLNFVQPTKVKAIGDTDDVAAALRKSRKHELLGVNWPALISWVKRAKRIPAELDKVLDVRVVDAVDVTRKKRGTR